MARCVLLSPPAQLAGNARRLFHCSMEQANTACLLEQVAAHLLAGLAQAAEAAGKAVAGPFRPRQLLEAHETPAGSAQAPSPAGGTTGSRSVVPAPQTAAQQTLQGGQQPRKQQLLGAAAMQGGALSRDGLAQAASLAVDPSLGAVLRATATAGGIVAQLQRYYGRGVAPHLAGSPDEARACAAALAAVGRAVEERVVGALQRCLAALAAQADMTLVELQDRTDFCPPEGGAPPPLDTPTPVCQATCALLTAAVEAAAAHLHGANLTSLLAEVCSNE
jgi:hypothetical protein